MSMDAADPIMFYRGDDPGATAPAVDWDALIARAGKGAWPIAEADAQRAAVAALPVPDDLRRLVVALGNEAYDAGARDYGDPEPHDLADDYALDISPAALRLLRAIDAARRAGATSPESR